MGEEVDYIYMIEMKPDIPSKVVTGLMQDVLNLAEEYAEETNLEFTFDRETTRDSLYEVAFDGKGHLVVMCRGAEVIGFSAVTYSRLFSVEPMASIVMFYIKPDARSYHSAIRFLDYTLRVIRDDCAYVLSNSVSLINDRITKAFGRLLERRGFTALSPTFIKRRG